MQKKLITCFAAILLVVSFSCQKQSDIKDQPTSAGKKYHLIDGDLTQGERHNLILETYMDATGYEFLPSMTKSEVEDLTYEFAVLYANAKGGMTTQDILDFTEDEMDYMENAGFFDSNDKIKTAKELCALMIASLPSGSKKTAYTQIYNYDTTATDSAFVAYDISTISLITGLTQAEQDVADGGADIVGSSYQLFSARMTNTQKAKFIFYADQIGLEAGSVRGNYLFPGNAVAATLYADYFSARCSAIAAKIAREL